jgi:hypothetical protein
MRLKEFITRSGGVITAIALLGSMMSMAGAAAPEKGGFDCSICGTYDATQAGSGITYQEKYLVADIHNLTNETSRVYSSDDSLLVACYDGQEICRSCLEKKVAEYKANLREGTSVDSTTGAASVPVTVAREAATFSVVVPTTLPISVDADGNVTTATDATIINNSGATVAVTKVELNSQSNWTLAAYSRDILNLPVDAKQFGLQMNIGDKTVATSNSGTSDVLSDSLYARIVKGQNCAVTYNALFPARTAAVSDTQIANVVFTVGWA